MGYDVSNEAAHAANGDSNEESSLLLISNWPTRFSANMSKAW